MSDEVEEIKNRLDIVDFISQYLTLKKAGQNWRSLCPFHKEKTPSFMVSRDKGIYKCFGCNRGGDVFTFAMEMEGLNFREALELLAQKTGVPLLRAKNALEYQQEKDEKSRLYQLNLLTARVFRKILLDHPAGKGALSYLKERKLTSQTIKKFILGFAPSGQGLEKILQQKGFTDKEIQQTGNPTRFTQRIMFPILDVMDNVLGFSGRATRADQEPKYLNTPETIIFHKGNILYGLEKAKSEIKGQDFAVLVEGQMDVVSSHQASVENAVATSGTALTEDHLRILSRYTQNISLAFDSDDAGQRAAQRAADLALEYGLNVKMIVLPASFKDPGEIASQSPKLWQEVAKSGIHVVDWYFQKAFAPYKQIGLGLDSLSKKTIAKQLLPVIKRLPDPIERDHYIQKLAKNLAVSERTIEEALGKVKESSAKQTKTTLPSKSQISVQKYLLALLLLSPDLWPKETLSEIFTEEDVWQVYKTGQKMYNKNTQRDFKQKVLSNLPSNLKTKVNFWLLEAEAKVKDSSKEELQKEINEIINRLENIKREKIKQDFAYKIAQAEEKGEIREMKKLIEQLSEAFKQEK